MYCAQKLEEFMLTAQLPILKKEVLLRPVKDGSGPASVPGRHGDGQTVRFDIITRPM